MSEENMLKKQTWKAPISYQAKFQKSFEEVALWHRVGSVYIHATEFRLILNFLKKIDVIGFIWYVKWELLLNYEFRCYISKKIINNVKMLPTFFIANFSKFSKLLL